MQTDTHTQGMQTHFLSHHTRRRLPVKDMLCVNCENVADI